MGSITAVKSFDDKTYALVLEGGGGKGSYHVGACKALLELGIKVGAVAGTSVGAINGAMFVQGDMDKLCKLWYDINPDKVFKITGEELEAFENIGLDTIIHKEKFNRIFKKIKKTLSEGGLDVQPLVDMVRNAVDEERIRSSPVEFGFVTVDITEKKPVEIFKDEVPQGKLADFIIASASFPVFKPAVIEGKTFVDGGFYNSLPVDMVIKKGYTDIITVRTKSIGVMKKINTSDLNIINIEPVEGLGPLLDFTSERSRINMKMGYYDTYKVFKKLKGKKYYIESTGDERIFIEFLLNIKPWQVSKIREIFAFSNENDNRMIFEQFVPAIANLLDLPASSGYEDVAVGLLEKTAEKMGIERFNIYSFRDFFQMVAAKEHYVEDEYLSELPVFLKRQELITRFNREKILSSVAGIVFSLESVARDKYT